MSLPADPATIDPLRQSDGPGDRPVTDLLYESLLSADPTTGEIVPGLATWTTSGDGRTYRFQIDEKAVWSDGKPVIAEDVITSVKAFARSKKAIGDGRSGIAYIEGLRDYRLGKAQAISGLRADGKVLTMTLTQSYCPVLGFLFLNPPLPTHVFAKYLSDADVSRNADDAAEHLAPTVTNGPFVFGEWRHGEQIVVRANDRYRRGRPLLDEIVFRISADPGAVGGGGPAAALRSGSVQLIAGVPRAGVDFADLEKEQRFKTFRVPSPGYAFIGWNIRSQSAPALQDKRVRQALAYGLDVDLAIRQILAGEATVTRQHMDRTSWAFTSGLEEYRFDPERAESLIRSAGYTKGADGIYQKDGSRLAFTMVTNQGNEIRTKLIQFASDQYRAIGVAVTPQLDTFAALLKKVADRDPTLDAFVLGYTTAVDPFMVEVWHSTRVGPGGLFQGLVGFSDVRVDEAIDDAQFGADCSVRARRRAYDTVNRTLNDEQPYDFLWTPNALYAMSTRLHGLVPGSYVALPDPHLWWLEPAK